MYVVLQERLPGRDFSFWKWFWANMNLVKNYVCKEWKEGSVLLSQFINAVNPLMPTVAIWPTCIKHPVPDRVKQSFIIFDIRSL